MAGKQLLDKPRILRHLDKWKLLYQTFGLIGVGVAIIVGSLSLIQTEKALSIAVSSLDLARKTMELQESEFMLRNRPLVVIGSHGFSGPTEGSGEEFPRSVTLQLLNVSEVPATQIEGTMEIRLDGQTLGQASLARDLDLAGDFPRGHFLGISEDAYSAAKDPSRRFEIATSLTYSGMLGEQPDQYSTRVVVHWSPTDERFMSSETSYK